MKFAWYAQVVQASLSCLGDMFGRNPLLTNHALLHTFTPLSFPPRSVATDDGWLNNHFTPDLTINLIGHNNANCWRVRYIQLLSLFVCILLSNKWIYLFHWPRQSLLQYVALVLPLIQLLNCLAHVVHGDLMNTSRQLLQWTWLDTTKPTDGVLGTFSSWVLLLAFHEAVNEFICSIGQGRVCLPLIQLWMVWLLLFMET